MQRIINGYEVYYSLFWHCWVVGHADIGRELAMFNTLADAKAFCD